MSSFSSLQQRSRDSGNSADFLEVGELPMGESVVTEHIALTKADRQQILQAAIRAPSADNNQPWIFRCPPDGRVVVVHDRTRALPSDVNNMFDYLALGAAVENICLAAGQLGIAASVHWLPLDEGPDAVAEIRFGPGGSTDPLAAQIVERCVNRHLYRKKAINQATLSELQETADAPSGVSLRWISERPNIRRLAGLIAQADCLRWQSEAFHAELFRQMRWTAQEAESKNDGLDVRTLEVSRLALAFLHGLKSWSRLRLWNRLGLTWLLTQPSARQVRCSGAIGVIAVERDDPDLFLLAGQSFQRLWLAATAHGIALHPLGSLPIFWRRSDEKDQAAIRKQFDLIVSDWGQGLPVILFRMGYCRRQPSVRSRRRPI